MADEDAINAVSSLIGNQLRNIGGGAAARAGLSVDVSQIKNLNEELKKLSNNLDEVKKRLPDLIKQMNDFGTASSVFGAGGGVGGTKDPIARAVQQSKVSKTRQQETLVGEAEGGGGGSDSISSRLAAFGRTPRGGAVATGGALALQALGPVISAVDKRIDRGASYALSADRLSVLYQQMTGLSQQQVQDKYRQPLTGYRLGTGGINTLLGLQAETGISAQKQASSAEALRTISGFTLSTGDTANMMSALARPETVNKMFMMTGQSFYGFGGKERSTMDVIKSIVNTMGLKDKKVVDSAFQPGSVTRARLKSAGVPEDMITTVLQYARQNITFKEKGGRGMYDPSDKEQRKKMGIEENFATQSEETTRTREAREEQFYSRQADNLADMEKATRNVTKALGALEDKLSGIVGARASTRGYQRIAGTALQAIGAATAFVNPAAGLAIMGTGTLVKGNAGDGTYDTGTKSSKNSSANTTSGGTSPKKASLPKRLSSGKYRNLKPEFAQRLYAMLKDNSRVHIGQGYRSSAQQEALFLKRHERTDEKTDIYWNGSYWKHVRGPDAAPPGRSMHEVGLAADLTGDLTWVQRNAHKYGLKTFANINNEPWHVQPAELPNSRREYERRGAPWGGDPSGRKHDEETEPPQGTDGDTGAEGPSRTPHAPPTGMPPTNTETPTNSGTSALEPPRNKKSKSRTGTTTARYAGMSISDILASVNTSLYSNYASSVSTGNKVGDGSFYTGTSSSSSSMEAPAISIPNSTGASTNSVINHNERAGDVFNIAPVINIGGNGGSVDMSDIKKLAKEVGRLIEEETRMRMARRH